MGCKVNSGGMCGSLSNDHLPRLMSCFSGTASSSRCPTAEEMTYSSFSKKSLDLSRLALRTLAISVATDGFSAMTNTLPTFARGLEPWGNFGNPFFMAIFGDPAFKQENSLVFSHHANVSRDGPELSRKRRKTC